MSKFSYLYFELTFLLHSLLIIYIFIIIKLHAQCFYMKCDESDEIQDIVALLNQNSQNAITPPSTVTFAQHDEIQM